MHPKLPFTKHLFIFNAFNLIFFFNTIASMQTTSGINQKNLIHETYNNHQDQKSLL